MRCRIESFVVFLVAIEGACAMPKLKGELAGGGAVPPSFVMNREWRVLDEHLKREAAEPNNPYVREIQPCATMPFRGAGVRFFDVNMDIDMDPVPPSVRFLVTPRGEIRHAPATVVETFAELKVAPGTDDEAVGLALAIVMCLSPEARVAAGPTMLFGAEDGAYFTGLYVGGVPEDARSKVAPPRARRSGDGYAVTLCVHRYVRPSRRPEAEKNALERWVVPVGPKTYAVPAIESLWAAEIPSRRKDILGRRGAAQP
jgi:hypothetical protein